MWQTEEELEYTLSDSEFNKVCKYLHGDCDEWVKEHYKKGDQIGTWIYEDQMFEGRYFLVHTFIIRDGTYMDARGATDDIYLMAEGYDDELLDVYEQLIVSDNLSQWKRVVLKELLHF